MPKVSVTAPVYPSEDPEKVMAAVKSIFPSGEFVSADGRIEGTADLDNFQQAIRRQRILDTARSQLQQGMGGSPNKTRFSLNKQVATVGKVSFVNYRIALGTIDVTVEDDDLGALIDRVAPFTVDGEEVRRRTPSASPARPSVRRTPWRCCGGYPPGSAIGSCSRSSDTIYRV